jgi:hypothetical protein
MTMTPGKAGDIAYLFRPHQRHHHHLTCPWRDVITATRVCDGVVFQYSDSCVCCVLQSLIVPQTSRGQWEMVIAGFSQNSVQFAMVGGLAPLDPSLLFWSRLLAVLLFIYPCTLYVAGSYRHHWAIFPSKFDFPVACMCLRWRHRFVRKFRGLPVQASRRSPAKKPTKTYERPGLSEEEIEEIREAFNLFDTDGSGR